MTVTIEAARAWAQEAHHGQVDKLGVDYMAHVEAVATAVALLGPNAMTVALLHDVVEDSPNAALADLDAIKKRFGSTVSAAVDAMTKRDGEAYELYLQRVRDNPIACAVKIADIAHNTSRIPLLSNQSERARLLRKYGAALTDLAGEA
jgi:(p)ppGpp synthase/HD superfamily hydrolase